MESGSCGCGDTRSMGTREWGPFIEMKSDKGMNPRVRSYLEPSICEVQKSGPTGTSGIGGCGGRKGFDLGLTFGRSTLAGRRIK
ncbi:hypothetical protein DPMN_117686 [Dreissena polymorpha]|uniref:Uncharacterized protein n=1 Tax=Dreissena polymorpha TaxID=45954 RepID=A0A9D4GFZ9_DREPO|nr:hypothetical protein DPMN_117686 [Dreissena polymorpha]